MERERAKNETLKLKKHELDDRKCMLHRRLLCKEFIFI